MDLERNLPLILQFYDDFDWSFGKKKHFLIQRAKGTIKTTKKIELYSLVCDGKRQGINSRRRRDSGYQRYKSRLNWIDTQNSGIPIDLKVGDYVVIIQKQKDARASWSFPQKPSCLKLGMHWWWILTKTEPSLKVMLPAKPKAVLLLTVWFETVFLPGSQIDVKPIVVTMDTLVKPWIQKWLKSTEQLKHRSQSFIERPFKSKEIPSSQVWKRSGTLEGVVKNITDFGVSDLGGVDGLLYITDISWEGSTTNEVLNSTKDQRCCFRTLMRTKQLSQVLNNTHPMGCVGQRTFSKAAKGRVNIEDRSFPRNHSWVEGLIHRFRSNLEQSAC